MLSVRKLSPGPPEPRDGLACCLAPRKLSPGPPEEKTSPRSQRKLSGDSAEDKGSPSRLSVRTPSSRNPRHLDTIELKGGRQAWRQCFIYFQ